MNLYEQDAYFSWESGALSHAMILRASRVTMSSSPSSSFSSSSADGSSEVGGVSSCSVVEGAGVTRRAEDEAAAGRCGGAAARADAFEGCAGAEARGGGRGEATRGGRKDNLGGGFGACDLETRAIATPEAVGRRWWCKGKRRGGEIVKIPLLYDKVRRALSLPATPT